MSEKQSIPHLLARATVIATIRAAQGFIWAAGFIGAMMLWAHFLPRAK